MKPNQHKSSPLHQTIPQEQLPLNSDQQNQKTIPYPTSSKSTYKEHHKYSLSPQNSLAFSENPKNDISSFQKDDESPFVRNGYLRKRIPHQLYQGIDDDTQPENLINCHQCHKIRPIKSVLTCKNAFCCESYCFPCIKKYYIKTVLKDKNLPSIKRIADRKKWACFKCEGKCNCGKCNDIINNNSNDNNLEDNGNESSLQIDNNNNYDLPLHNRRSLSSRKKVYNKPYAINIRNRKFIDTEIPSNEKINKIIIPKELIDWTSIGKSNSNINLNISGTEKVNKIKSNNTYNERLPNCSEKKLFDKLSRKVRLCEEYYMHKCKTNRIKRTCNICGVGDFHVNELLRFKTLYDFFSYLKYLVMYNAKIFEYYSDIFEENKKLICELYKYYNNNYKNNNLNAENKNLIEFNEPKIICKFCIIKAVNQKNFLDYFFMLLIDKNNSLINKQYTNSNNNLIQINQKINNINDIKSHQNQQDANTINNNRPINNLDPNQKINNSNKKSKSKNHIHHHNNINPNIPNINNNLNNLNNSISNQNLFDKLFDSSSRQDQLISHTQNYQTSTKNTSTTNIIPTQQMTIQINNYNKTITNNSMNITTPSNQGLSQLSMQNIQNIAHNVNQNNNNIQGQPINQNLAQNPNFNNQMFPNFFTNFYGIPICLDQSMITEIKSLHEIILQNTHELLNSLCAYIYAINHNNNNNLDVSSLNEFFKTIANYYNKIIEKYQLLQNYSMQMAKNLDSAYDKLVENIDTIETLLNVLGNNYITDIIRLRNGFAMQRQYFFELFMAFKKIVNCIADKALSTLKIIKVQIYYLMPNNEKNNLSCNTTMDINNSEIINMEDNNNNNNDNNNNINEGGKSNENNNNIKKSIFDVATANNNENKNEGETIKKEAETIKDDGKIENSNSKKENNNENEDNNNDNDSILKQIDEHINEEEDNNFNSCEIKIEEEKEEKKKENIGTIIDQ